MRRGQKRVARHHPAGQQSALLQLHGSLLLSILKRLRCASKCAVAVTCRQLCAAVRGLSASALHLNDTDGVVACRLPAGRRFTSCTRLTYSCCNTQQQHLVALEQVLEHAATCMPHAASLQLHLKAIHGQQQLQQRRRSEDTSLTRVRTSCFKALGGLPCLTALHLELPSLTDKQLRLLGDLEQLQTLDLHLPSHGSQQLQLSHLRPLANLHTLRCTGLVPMNDGSNSTGGSSGRGTSDLPSSLTVLHIGVATAFSWRWWSRVVAAAAVGGGGRLQELVVRYDTHLSLGWLQGCPSGFISALARPRVPLQLRSLRFSVSEEVEEELRRTPELLAGLGGPLYPTPGLQQLQQLTCLQMSSFIQGDVTVKLPAQWDHLASCRQLVSMSRLVWSGPADAPLPVAWGLPALQRADLFVGTCTMKQLLSFVQRCPALHTLWVTIQHLLEEDPPHDVRAAADTQQQQQQQSQQRKQPQQRQQQGEKSEPHRPAVADGTGAQGERNHQELHGTGSSSSSSGAPQLAYLRLIIRNAADAPQRCLPRVAAAFPRLLVLELAWDAEWCEQQLPDLSGFPHLASLILCTHPEVTAEQVQACIGVLPLLWECQWQGECLPLKDLPAQKQVAAAVQGRVCYEQGNRSHYTSNGSNISSSSSRGHAPQQQQVKEEDHQQQQQEQDRQLQVDWCLTRSQDWSSGIVLFSRGLELCASSAYAVARCIKVLLKTALKELEDLAQGLHQIQQQQADAQGGDSSMGPNCQQVDIREPSRRGGSRSSKPSLLPGVQQQQQQQAVQLYPAKQDACSDWSEQHLRKQAGTSSRGLPADLCCHPSSLQLTPGAAEPQASGCAVSHEKALHDLQWTLDYLSGEGLMGLVNSARPLPWVTQEQATRVAAAMRAGIAARQQLQQALLQQAAELEKLHAPEFHDVQVLAAEWAQLVGQSAWWFQRSLLAVQPAVDAVSGCRMDMLDQLAGRLTTWAAAAAQRLGLAGDPASVDADIRASVSKRDTEAAAAAAGGVLEGGYVPYPSGAAAGSGGRRVITRRQHAAAAAAAAAGRLREGGGVPCPPETAGGSSGRRIVTRRQHAAAAAAMAAAAGAGAAGISSQPCCRGLGAAPELAAAVGTRGGGAEVDTSAGGSSTGPRKQGQQQQRQRQHQQKQQQQDEASLDPVWDQARALSVPKLQEELQLLHRAAGATSARLRRQLWLRLQVRLALEEAWNGRCEQLKLIAQGELARMADERDAPQLPAHNASM